MNNITEKGNNMQLEKTDEAEDADGLDKTNLIKVINKEDWKVKEKHWQHGRLSKWRHWCKRRKLFYRRWEIIKMGYT